MLDGLTQWLLDPTGLTPHGFCLLWEPGLIWTHGLADFAIGLAYFTIPVALASLVRRRQDLAFRPIFWLFAAFILLCGAGHWISLLTLWVPAYGLEAVVKVATAAVSVVTAVAVWPLLPKALALPSPAQLRGANTALRESEARHRASYANTPLPLHTLDETGTILSVSERWLDLLGYRREEVLGRRITDFHDEKSARRTHAGWPILLRDGVKMDVPRRFRHRDGRLLDMLVSAVVEHDPDGSRRVLVAMVDVTARLRAEAALRESEERLRQAQKMEAIGQLTGGIAHDFNNVLTAVSGNLELIRRRVGQDRPDVTHFADNALDAAAKAAGLTAQLLTVARRQHLDPRPLDPVTVVEGMRALLSRTAGDRIALRVAAEPGVGCCLADRNQLESALLNLVINARDALDGPGEITLSLRPERVEGTSEGALPAGDYVRIAVRDNGPGMPDEVRRRAFEPFFTTKRQGKGSGLGLAQIHGFAHQSGGTASIVTAPGEGTEVAMLLVRTEDAAPLADPAAAPPAERDGEVVGGRGELVLVVEDDARVRGALVELLRDLGFGTLEAETADLGLRLLEGGAGVAAILTDLTMPGSMDGLEFAVLARSRYPTLPVVLTTGHLDPLSGRSLPAGIGFLQKPYDRRRVAAALRGALERGRVSVAA